MAQNRSSMRVRLTPTQRAAVSSASVSSKRSRSPPARDQPAQAFRQRRDGEAEPFFAEPAPAQAFGRRAEQLGGGGVEVDDLEVGRPPRVVLDDGERHHAVVAGVEHGVDQIVARAPLGQMDGDERRTPAVGERQSEDVVALGLTVAREIGFALARLSVGRRPGRPPRSSAKPQSGASSLNRVSRPPPPRHSATAQPRRRISQSDPARASRTTRSSIAPRPSSIRSSKRGGASSPARAIAQRRLSSAPAGRRKRTRTEGRCERPAWASRVRRSRNRDGRQSQVRLRNR